MTPKPIDAVTSLLGRKARDRVTGFTGVITSVNYDLYGCVQVVLAPGVDKEGKKQENGWFDVGRLKVESVAPVMAVPDFSLALRSLPDYQKGPESKPIPSDGPR